MDMQQEALKALNGLVSGTVWDPPSGDHPNDYRLFVPGDKSAYDLRLPGRYSTVVPPGMRSFSAGLGKIVNEALGTDTAHVRIEGDSNILIPRGIAEDPRVIERLIEQAKRNQEIEAARPPEKDPYENIDLHIKL